MSPKETYLPSSSISCRSWWACCSFCQRGNHLLARRSDSLCRDTLAHSLFAVETRAWLLADPSALRKTCDTAAWYRGMRMKSVLVKEDRE